MANKRKQNKKKYTYGENWESRCSSSHGDSDRSNRPRFEKWLCPSNPWRVSECFENYFDFFKDLIWLLNF